MYSAPGTVCRKRMARRVCVGLPSRPCVCSPSLCLTTFRCVGLPDGCCLSVCVQRRIEGHGDVWRVTHCTDPPPPQGTPSSAFPPLLLHVAGVQVAQTWCEDNLLVSVFKSKSTTNTAQKPNPCDRFLGHGNAFNASVRLPSFSGHHCGARNVLTAPDTALYPSCPLSPPRSVFPILCLAKAPPSRT